MIKYFSLPDGGWALALFALVQIPFWFVYEMFLMPGNTCSKVRRKNFKLKILLRHFNHFFIFRKSRIPSNPMTIGAQKNPKRNSIGFGRNLIGRLMLF